MTRSSLEGEWEDQPDDPDGEDLGYDLDDWERIRATGVDSEKFLYLPDDEEMLREVVRPAEDALTHLPAVTVARSAAENVATGAPVYAPGVIDVDDAALPPGLRGDAPTDGEADPDPPLAACFTPDGTAVCLGRVVGDPDAESGTVVALERVLL